MNVYFIVNKKLKLMFLVFGFFKKGTKLPNCLNTCYVTSEAKYIHMINKYEYQRKNGNHQNLL